PAIETDQFSKKYRKSEQNAHRMRERCFTCTSGSWSDLNSEWQLSHAFLFSQKKNIKRKYKQLNLIIMKKKNRILGYPLMIIGLIFILTISCKKENSTSQTPTPTPTPSSGIIFNPNLNYGTVTDIDGNVYKTIVIGSKTWMAENLRVTHYRNGDPIINGNTNWGGADTGKYCEYNNNPINSLTYGKLYNWYAVDDIRGLAPTGWSVQDFYPFTTYLGGLSIVGGKLKEISTSHWQSPNVGATNESGFTALPGGYRDGNSPYSFTLMGYNGYYWSSDYHEPVPGSTKRPYNSIIYFDGTSVSRLYTNDLNSRFGYSVRCVKD
ncbi:MAG: fibrobacter succinogenes major paralogous domain-containing protein, partial [Bacteroidales bacterium]